MLESKLQMDQAILWKFNWVPEQSLMLFKMVQLITNEWKKNNETILFFFLFHKKGDTIHKLSQWEITQMESLEVRMNNGPFDITGH